MADIQKIIKDLQGNFSGTNEEQGKAVALLKGLAFSDEDLANEFMTKLDAATTKISKEVLKEKKESFESNTISLLEGQSVEAEDGRFYTIESGDILIASKED